MSEQDIEPVNVIDLETAQDWTGRWRTDCPDNCKAFLIPIDDVLEVLDEMGIIKVKDEEELEKYKDYCLRAYMGIALADELPEKQRKRLNLLGEEKKNDKVEKMIVVGTKKDKNGVYRDMIETLGGKKDDNKNPFSGKIYDSSIPCPPECDDESPLN